MTLRSPDLPFEIVVEQPGPDKGSNFIVPSVFADRFNGLRKLVGGDVGFAPQFLAAVLVDDFSPRRTDDAILANAAGITAANEYLAEHADVPVLAIGRVGVVAGIADHAGVGIVAEDASAPQGYATRLKIPSQTSIDISNDVGGLRFEARARHMQDGWLSLFVPTHVATDEAIDPKFVIPDVSVIKRGEQVLAVGREAVDDLIKVIDDCKPTVALRKSLQLAALFIEPPSYY